MRLPTAGMSNFQTMEQKPGPSGTDPAADPDSIIAGELQKLQEYRSKIGSENQRYIDGHPELRTLVDDFVSAVIAHKPEDLVKFGAFFFSDRRKNHHLGPCPVVIAGPSGVGKGTLINRLLGDFPELFGFSVSHTTRAPRQGEEHGVHYHFVTKGEFEQAVEKGDFIEYAKVHTSYYGTSLQAVEKVRSKNKICVLDIDIQGVQNVKKSNLDCKYLFVMPPDMLELEQRLVGRGTESMEKVKIRLENAVAEVEYGNQEGNFDAVIVNNDLDETYRELLTLLQQWYPDLDLALK